MKIIAIEEAFSVDGIGSPHSGNTSEPVQASVARDWDERLADFTKWRLPTMDDNGISMQVLSLTVPGIQGLTDIASAVTDATKANDYLAGVVGKHPDRFKGFAALALQDPAEAVRELRRCVRELGFCGALVNDHTNGHYLDEPQFDPVWAALEELDVPIYIHPGAPPLDSWNVLKGHPEMAAAEWAWGAQVGGHALRIVLSGIFDKHPKTRLILGHMGEFLPFQLWRFDSRYETMKDRPLEHLPSEYFGRNVFITTSGVFSPAALAGAILAVGEDAVLFSVDYPYESSDLAVRFLKSAPISSVTREKIAHGNAERILRIG